MSRNVRLAAGISFLMNLAGSSALYGTMKYFDHKIDSIKSEIGKLGESLSAYRADLDRVEVWDTLRNSAERSEVANRIAGAMQDVSLYDTDIGELRYKIDQLAGPLAGTIAIGAVLGAVYLKAGGAGQIKNGFKRAYEVLVS